MTNPLRGEASIDVEGRELRLVFDVDTLIAVEEKLDMAVGDFAKRLNRLGVLRAVLWAALRKHHPEVTLEESGDLLVKIGLSSASDQLGRALVAAFPQPRDDEEAASAEGPRKARRAKAGTGPNSSSSGAP